MKTEPPEVTPIPPAEPEPDPDPDGPRAPGIAVEVSDTQAHLRIDPDALARLARATLRAEGVERATVSMAVVDDPTIRAVNREHLAHDWPTDVITFRLSEPGDDELQGELVLSAEMAASTARAAGVDPWHELALYAVHGLLHLTGHDDEAEPDRAAMRVREGEVLRALGLTNTFGAADAPDRESERSAP